MRPIDADALLAECQLAQKQADRHGREFANAFYSGGGDVSTEWWCVEDMIENAPTIEPEREKGRWIPCSERLPDEGYVLISKKPKKYFDGGRRVTIAIRMEDSRSRKVNWWDIGFGVIPDDNVPAWMPLPESYREESEKDG